MSFPEHIPTATVELDKPRKIASTVLAARRFRDETGKSLVLVAQDGAELLDHLGVIIWSMLDKEGREALSLEEIEEMLPYGERSAPFVEAITKVVVESHSQAPEGAGGNPRTKAQKKR